MVCVEWIFPSLTLKLDVLGYVLCIRTMGCYNGGLI